MRALTSVNQPVSRPYYRALPAPAVISQSGHAPTRSEQVLLRLTPSELTDLDTLCEHMGLSRQQVLRATLRMALVTEVAHA